MSVCWSIIAVIIAIIAIGITCIAVCWSNIVVIIAIIAIGITYITVCWINIVVIIGIIAVGIAIIIVIIAIMTVFSNKELKLKVIKTKKSFSFPRSFYFFILNILFKSWNSSNVHSGNQ
jgi:hypothetical protein